MKTKIILISLITILTGKVYSQKEFEVFRTENFQYPYIKFYIKTNSLYTNKSDFTLMCDSANLEFDFEEMVYEENDISKKVFFIIDSEIASDKNIQTIIAKSLTFLNRRDKINMIIFKNENNGKYTANMLSPEFSQNYMYFNDMISAAQNINSKQFYNDFVDIIYKAKIITTQSEDKTENTAIIIISKQLKITQKKSEFSKKLKMIDLPIYINVFADDTSNFHKYKEIGKNTGGIFKQTDSLNLEKDLRFFFNDISSIEAPSGNKAYILTIKNSDNRKNYVKIKFGKTSKIVFYEQPPYVKYLKYRNYAVYLAVFSGILLFILFAKYFRKTLKLKKQLQIFVKNTIETEYDSKTAFAAPAEITLQTKGYNKTFIIRKKESILGRNNDCDFEIPDSTVSGIHAQIKIENNEYFITDLSSTNGTFLNGEKINFGKLKNNDKIKLGSAFLVFKLNR